MSTVGLSQINYRNKIRKIASVLNTFLGVPVQPAKRAKPLVMLIATILSQNTNDKNSHRAYVALKKKFPTWRDLANAPTRSIISAIKTGGMANQKSKRIKQILHNIYNRFGDYSLDSLKSKSNEEIMEILLSFDGVGVKTAACVLLFSMRKDVFPVDTHVHRILGRLGVTSGCKTPEDTFNAAGKFIPKGMAYSLHTNLIRFGRKICKATTPHCDLCPLYQECVFEKKKEYKNKFHSGKSKQNIDFMLLDNV
ncbi:MAG: endonuclease III [Ignavibacteriales bacterium]|nr:endonuclease III [Ignavibacteriales bacterium]